MLAADTAWRELARPAAPLVAVVLPYRLAEICLGLLLRAPFAFHKLT